jgi:hypothetical protein
MEKLRTLKVLRACVRERTQTNSKAQKQQQQAVVHKLHR